MLRIVGFGNTLHGDDGFAAVVIEQLNAWLAGQDQGGNSARSKATVECVFGGTAGLNAMGLFDRCDEVIVVDIIRRDMAKAPLAWYSVEEVIALDFNDDQGNNAHGQGLGYLFKSLQSISTDMPLIRCLLCASDMPTAYTIALSDTIKGQVDEAVKLLARYIESFLAGFPIPVHDVKLGATEGIWLGSARLPNKRFASKVMIFARDEQYYLVSALCPHKGFDLSDQVLNEQGELVCPLHHLAINVFDSCTLGSKDHYIVEKTMQNGQPGFVITGFNQ